MNIERDGRHMAFDTVFGLHCWRCRISWAESKFLATEWLPVFDTEGESFLICPNCICEDDRVEG